MVIKILIMVNLVPTNQSKFRILVLIAHYNLIIGENGHGISCDCNGTGFIIN
jgi:hypothetical protein